ncbi:hypothetical protein BN439_1562 [Erwinia amylovora Ea644]|uniref:Uncharacterized protein n=2 Tax=Erwinia amylovora TaxID=552 RepID=A0A831EQ06_ERWAM|nr:hypothetical protein EaACW_1239 [Erwinia amylovora ACW56400]CBA20179.1 hypothetical protein predicted by Glimmer/Critica [Erwinia amylovora CFBP1430]CCO78084.1 hypothetical protein BN432_1274 [Erwinia amylovora Ea356]CCO81871.1 hypothetical protein BN433_1287 [Erwinia amylovora Ea266]CCO85670.1 hypothetical protein BN434_1270 [Erwinia amylovora CFBP 2585]CCO89456.1 hypothetical protein BN435_1272 [Erwinia amylovora 01SFR-BO]CCO93208.1 hypothetical protein BN437_1266 [Erwinia amylovora NBRC
MQTATPFVYPRVSLTPLSPIAGFEVGLTFILVEN